MNDRLPQFAEIQVLPAPYADKILSAPSIEKVRTLYNVTLPLAIMAGIGLLVWALISQNRSTEDGDVSMPASVICLYSLGSIAVCAVVAIRLLIGTRRRWLLRIARKEVMRRPDKIVDPDAPGIRFVEIVPKSNWSDESLVENATDIGFLAVDPQKKLLLYEGDNERYRIPASAIVKCEQDSYTRRVIVKHRNLTIYFFFVVVTIRVSEQMTVELPFRIRCQVNIYGSDQKARDANYKFLQDINHLKASARPAVNLPSSDE